MHGYRAGLQEKGGEADRDHRAGGFFSSDSKAFRGKNLYEISDVVLDNCTPEGDSCIDLEGFDGKICGMSMITTSVLVQAVTYRAAEILIEKGITPPIYKSQNIDGGREFNEALEAEYIDRLYRI